MKKELPIGVQTFEKIIKGDFMYVDKTALIYKMTHEYSYVFLSRPRRFGKSTKPSSRYRRKATTGPSSPTLVPPSPLVSTSPLRRVASANGQQQLYHTNYSSIKSLFTHPKIQSFPRFPRLRNRQSSTPKQNQTVHYCPTGAEQSQLQDKRLNSLTP